MFLTSIVGRSCPLPSPHRRRQGIVASDQLLGRTHWEPEGLYSKLPGLHLDCPCLPPVPHGRGGRALVSGDSRTLEPSAPRAGWSQAMIIRLPSICARSALGRWRRALAKASGSRIRIWESLAIRLTICHRFRAWFPVLREWAWQWSTLDVKPPARPRGRRP